MINKQDLKAIQFNNTSVLRRWLEVKHYTHRKPTVSYGFGLIKKPYDTLVGGITFGVSANYNLDNICRHKYKVIEFNRLCIDMPKEDRKNIASWFCTRAIKQLPKPLVIVSYADQNQNHIGYIYQSLNWLYTGLSAKSTIWEKEGKQHHAKSVNNTTGLMSEKHMIENGYFKSVAKQKYRYVFFHGDKRQKRDMMKNLQYEILPYPKGETKQYDCSQDVKTNLGFSSLMEI